MLALFLNSSAEQLRALGESIARLDTAEAARLAHKIKGGSAYVGAIDMVGHATSAEIAAKNSDLRDLKNAQEDLQTSFERLRAEMEIVMKNHGAG